MSSKKDAPAAGSTELQVLSTQAVALPDRYQRVGSASNAPWFNLREGNKMEGHLIGVFTRPDTRTESKTSEFFQVEIIADTEVRVGRGEEAEVMIAKAGTIVNLNVNPKTSVLKDLIGDIKRGGAWDCFVHVGKKFPIKDGRKMWDITVGQVQVRAPRAEEQPDFEDDDAAA